MESTKVALESERKIQMLQMQAINALWKKVSAIQPEGSETIGYASNCLPLNNVEIVKDLAQTCSVLQNQVSIKATKRAGINCFFRSSSCKDQCKTS